MLTFELVEKCFKHTPLLPSPSHQLTFSRVVAVTAASRDLDLCDESFRGGCTGVNLSHASRLQGHWAVTLFSLVKHQQGDSKQNRATYTQGLRAWEPNKLLWRIIWLFWSVQCRAKTDLRWLLFHTLHVADSATAGSRVC